MSIELLERRNQGGSGSDVAQSWFESRVRRELSERIEARGISAERHQAQRTRRSTKESRAKISFGTFGLLSLSVRGRGDGRLRFLRGFGFSQFQFRLARVGGFGGIGPSSHLGFLEEITPALVVIGGALGILKLSYGGLSILLAPDHLDYASRLVSSDIVKDDCVGCALFVACQKESIRYSIRSVRV